MEEWRWAGHIPHWRSGGDITVGDITVGHITNVGDINIGDITIVGDITGGGKVGGRHRCTLYSGLKSYRRDEFSIWRETFSDKRHSLTRDTL